MMYKIQHQLLDIDRDLYLIPGDSRTRGQYRFFQERSNYDTLRNSFQRTTREWNHLPDTTVGASSIEELRASKLATPTSVNSFNCVIVKCLVVHSLGDISCVCLAYLVPQNLKQSATTHVLHWKKKKIQCGCTCVYDLLIAFSKFLTERHVHIRQQSVGLSCPNLNLSILHIFKSMI